MCRSLGLFSALLLHGDSEAMNRHASRSWGTFQSGRLWQHRRGAVPTQIIIFRFLNLPRCFSWLQPCFLYFYLGRGRAGRFSVNHPSPRPILLMAKANAIGALVTYKVMDSCEPAHGVGFRGQEKDIRERKGPTDETRQLCRDTLVG